MANPIVSLTDSISNSETENWRPVVGYETYYEVSDLGRVRRIHAGKSTYPGKVLKGGTKPIGYKFVILSVNGIVTNRNIHILVADAFLGERPEGAVVNHRDGDKSNSRASNLEYTTQKGNVHHALLNDLMFPTPPDHEVIKVIDLLKQENPRLSYVKIAQMTAIPLSTVRSIAKNSPSYELKGYEKPISETRRKIKLSLADRDEIKRLVADGMKQQDVAALFKVDPGVVSRIKTGTYSTPSEKKAA